MRFTLLPVLVALVVAIANSPIDIYQICAWNVGTLKVEPWRAARTSGAQMRRLIVNAAARMRGWFADLRIIPLLTEELGVLTNSGRVKQLLQLRADTLREMTAFRDKIAGENRAMTEDERKTFAALEAKFDGIKEDLAIEQRAQERERAMQVETDSAAEATRQAEAAARVQVGKDRAEDDPKKGFKTHTEFLRSVMKEGGRPTGAKAADPRLEYLRVKATVGSDEQSGNEGQYGAFLVPAGFAPTLLEVTPEDDPTATLVTPMPMTNPIVTVPARTDKDHTTSVSGGLIVTRKRETIAATSARMSVEQVAFHANSAFGLSYATEEILVDSPISFVSIISAGFRDQFTSFLFNERLNGIGSGEPLGVMNSPALVAVAKESGQAAKTIVTENIDKMVASSWKYSKAIWLANHDTFPQLQGLTRSIGVGGALSYYLQPNNDPSSSDFKLLGRPIYFSEYPQTLGTQGDLLLVVWSEYIHGTYQPLESAESIHVRFETHERTFKFWLRDDGQPWWKAPLTPKRGANKLSPYVALASR